MLWQPTEPPAKPRVRTPRRAYKGHVTFRARLLPLFDHFTAMSAPAVARVFGMTTEQAGIRLAQLVTSGDLVRVRVHARHHRTEYRRAT